MTPPSRVSLAILCPEHLDGESGSCGKPVHYTPKLDVRYRTCREGGACAVKLYCRNWNHFRRQCSLLSAAVMVEERFIMVKCQC